MKIGVDARSIFLPRPRGTGRNLLDAYRRIPWLQPDWQFVLYHQRARRECSPPPLLTDDERRAEFAPGTAANRRPSDPWGLPNVAARRIDIPGDRFNLWFHLRLPVAAWRDGIDLLHLPANAAPLRCSVPFVVTIHDLAPLEIDDELSPRARAAFYRGVKRAVTRAAHVITVSDATADDLHRYFGIPRDQVTTIPWAPDNGVVAQAGGESGRPDERTMKRLCERYGLTPPWMLNFSGASRRKNAAGLIEGVARLPVELRGRFQLVFVGCEPESVRAQVLDRAKRLGGATQCRVLGFVPHEDLGGLLSGAQALLMPSLYEGFGLPILDAFACGTPVLTSNTSSMPEVAGDAAIYCNPRDARSIADGIARLLDESVAAELVQRGRERLRQFSWERTARAMCQVYECCLAQRSGVKHRARDSAPPALFGASSGGER
ncbi:MAG: glycosyltransferase family 4 protein [Planctomycetes bacterium]|nr:glycosyltransferase family 4 protein [Planctomycetota bacterium]